MWAAVAGLAVLAVAWGGPLPAMVAESFSAHMALHIIVVAVAAPLLALGLAPWVTRQARPGLFLPVVASLVDFAVVWGWHAPALQEAARTDGTVLALEQGMFLGAALAVWLVALCAPPLIGMLELLFTSMHMVLLGALIGLAPRAMFHVHSHAMADQHLGGAIMLGAGGAVYLAGGLFIGARLLRMEAAK